MQTINTILNARFIFKVFSVLVLVFLEIIADAQCPNRLSVVETSQSQTCGPRTVVYTATNYSAYDGEILWYRDPDGPVVQSNYVDSYAQGNIVDAVFTIDVGANTTLYVSFWNPSENCESERYAINISVATPVTFTPQIARICSDNIVQLKITSPSQVSIYEYLGSNNFRWLQSSSTGTFSIPLSSLQTFNGTSVTLYGKLDPGYCLDQSYRPILIQRDIPTSPPTISDVTACVNSSVTLSPQIDRLTCNWYNNSTLVYQGKDFTTPSFSQTGGYIYDVATVGYNGCEGPRKQVKVTIEGKPVNSSISANPSAMCLGESVGILSSGGVGEPHYWCSTNGGASWNIFADSFASKTSFNFTPTSAGTYRILVKNKNSCGFCSDCGDNSFVNVVVTKSIDCQDVNYIITDNPQIRGQDFSTEDLLDVEKTEKTIVYYDGLGNNMQSVLYMRSPTAKDIVTPVVYDNYGRIANEYKPFTISNNGFVIDNSALIDGSAGTYKELAAAFYSNPSDAIADDPEPRTRTIFEPSPLNRIAKKGVAGAAWQPNVSSEDILDHSLKTQYLLNETSEVLRFDYVNGRLSLAPSSDLNRYYPAASLEKQIMFDESNHQTIEYKENGRVVLKKIEAGSEGGVKVFAETYYIYDDMGNLVFVIPPQGLVSLLAVISEN